MDPISTIIAALVAGAAAAAKETAGSAIKDSYEGLKALLKKKLAGQANAPAAVDAHHDDVKKAEAALRPALAEAGAGSDEALIAAARTLLAEAAKLNTRYQLNVQGDVQGLVQGDGATVTMSFGSPTPRNG